jgi:hypothetical protein
LSHFSARELLLFLKDRMERDRLRQERKRRAAGIPRRGAQEALDEANGFMDKFGRLTDQV